LNLGYVALQADHYDEAVDWSISANDEATRIGYKNLAQIAAGNLGWAYYQLGDSERALDQFLMAERVAAQLGNLRYQLKWLSTAGYVYRDMGDWQGAARSYREALDLARQIQSREDVMNALQDLADIALVSGHLDDASNYIDEALPMESKNGSRPSSILLFSMGKLAAARNQYAQAEHDLDSVRYDSASLMTTRLNAGYELAKLYEVQHNTVAAERLYRTTLAVYDSARGQLKSEESQLPFGANAAQIYDSYIRMLVQAGNSDAALEQADESRARTLEGSLSISSTNKATQFKTGDPRNIARATHSTLLFYWLGDNESFLWSITPTKVTLVHLPPRKQITDVIERYRKTLLDLRDPLKTQDADGQALYQMLVAPAAKLIQPNTPVILLDEGELSKLNFETLLAPGPAANPTNSMDSTAGLHYLLDDFTISSAPSLAMLAAAPVSSGSAQKMLLLGDPVPADREFPTLPMFSFEMSRVGNHFASKQVFAGSAATPAAYVSSHPEQYTHIHFVSHAVASSTTPLDSAIILSNTAGQDGSYKLYAREIIQHPIQAKLVTISACYGTGTRAYAGEGLVGLSWAFLRAGAQEVIGALWEVSDESTPRLMDGLYQGISEGQSPAQALHKAKLALVHSQTRFRAPFYWAPFQLYERQ
jgi:CHAT domain-containing protein